MATETKNGLLEAAERIGVPVATISYVVAFAVNVHESAGKLGWRTFAILAFMVCLSWCFYVWLARRPSELQPLQSIRRFGPTVRLGATVAAIASALPLLYIVLVRYPPPLVPFLFVQITNATAKPVTIDEYGEFFLTEVATPGFDNLVQSGRIKFQSAQRPDTFTIQPKQSRAYGGRFQNEQALVPLLARGDLKLAVIIKTEQGMSMTIQDIPFAADGYGKTLFQINIE
jgi:hypothetical protein